MDSDKEKKIGKPETFVKYIMELCLKDKGAAAAIRRADNPATEYQSWEYLARLVDLENPFELSPYITIAAAIARAKPEHDGNNGIGKAIAYCYEEKNESDQAKAKLRRLLACDTVVEACRILRPLLSLIDSKATIKLDYSRLLRDLDQFRYDSNKVKTKWATDFYHYATKNEEENA